MNRRMPVPRWRRGLRASARRLRRIAVAGLLVSACGGRATSSSPSELGPGWSSDFLAPCDQSCGSGFECISGLCSRSCDDDVDCLDLSSRATCQRSFASGEGQARCEVECATDEGCVNALGEGYHCGGAFCRAGGAVTALGTLPTEFTILELDRADPAPSSCPQGRLERSKLNRKLSMLIWSTCDAASEGVSLSGDQALSPSELEKVLSAYANLRSAAPSECTTDIPVLTLDVDGDAGVSGRYVDAASAACPMGTTRRGAVTGLERLREVMLDLRGAR
jgi:hypothetical protein